MGAPRWVWWVGSQGSDVASRGFQGGPAAHPLPLRPGPGPECVGASQGAWGCPGRLEALPAPRRPGHRGLTLQLPPLSPEGPWGPWELKPPFPGPVMKVTARRQWAVSPSPVRTQPGDTGAGDRVPFSSVTICATGQRFKGCGLVFLSFSLQGSVFLLHNSQNLLTHDRVPISISQSWPLPTQATQGLRTAVTVRSLFKDHVPAPTSSRLARGRRGGRVPSHQPQALLVTDHTAPGGVVLGPRSRRWQPPPVPVPSAPARGETWAQTDPVPFPLTAAPAAAGPPRETDKLSP